MHDDHSGSHVVLSVPRGIDAVNLKRMQYAGPRVIMPETVQDFAQWLQDRKREGFVLTAVE